MGYAERDSSVNALLCQHWRLSYKGVSKVDLLLVCYIPLANLKKRRTRRRRIVRDTQLTKD